MVKWCKLTRKEYGEDPSEWPPEGSLDTPEIDVLFNLIFKRSDCGGIECLAAWEELSRKDINHPTYKMSSEKAALHVENKDKIPNDWVSPYDSIRRELIGASAPMV